MLGLVHIACSSHAKDYPLISKLNFIHSGPFTMAIRTYNTIPKYIKTENYTEN